MIDRAMTADLGNRLERAMPGHVEKGVPLSTLTTFRIGGPAALLVRALTIDHLRVVRHALAAAGAGIEDVLAIGQGSNLLIGDRGFAGLVVVLAGAFEGIERIGPGELRAGGAVKLPVLARRSAAWGSRGLEWMVGVPGSVGGAVRMNAGGHGSDVAASLIDAALFDLAGDREAEQIVAASALELGYRRSSVSSSTVVAWARFAVRDGDAAAAEAEISEIVRWRREHQPGGANCGSVFTNPAGDSAGRLIDATGLKGLRVGTAAVSDKHANFIQADDGARSADVWALIVEIRRLVHASSGIVLEPEVRTIGFDAALPQLEPGGAPADVPRGEDARGDATRANDTRADHPRAYDGNNDEGGHR